MSIPSPMRIERKLVPIPTYLKEFLSEQENNMLLIYKEAPDGDALVKERKFSSNDSQASEVELIGNPLELDFAADVSLNSTLTYCESPNWKSSELNYHPFGVCDARKCVQDVLSSKNIEGDVTPVFCLTDGNDDARTVALGAAKLPKYITRYIVNILGCYPVDHKFTTMEYMKKAHFKFVEKNHNLQITVKKCYWKFGVKNLESVADLSKPPCNGAVSFESTHNEENDKIVSLTLVMHMIAGHHLSPLHNIWEDLNQLKSYLNISGHTRHISDSTILTSTFHYLDPYQRITDLLLNANIFKIKANKTLDLNNLRPETFLDKLLKLLKECHTVNLVRECFHELFEKIIESTTIIQIEKDNCSLIATILREIIEGKSVIPTLNFAESLELLIDLYLEKLKDDYLTIIDSFAVATTDYIIEQWKSLSVRSETKNITAKRKSRFTMGTNLENISSTNYWKKVNFLERIHVACEFFFLVKTRAQPMSSDNFEMICSNIVKKYISSPILNYNKESALHEVKLSLNSIDKNLIDDLKRSKPIKYTVELTTALKSSKITTIFHLAQFQIFPPIIFNKYETEVDSECVYITKLGKYVTYL